MKKIFFIFAVALSSLLVSCNEELIFDVTVQEAPSITSFSPATGVVGTEITIMGENLQNVTSAYINNVEVVVSSRISGNIVSITATQDASSGVIKLVSAEGDAISSEQFTYSYPTPTITSIPSAITAGEWVYVEGENLSAVLELWIDSSVSGLVQVTELTTASSELLFKVPSIAAGSAELQIVYYDGSASTRAGVGTVAIANDGVMVLSSLEGTYAMGDYITVEGSGLAVVSQVLIGDVAQSIIGDVTSSSFTFEIVDDAAFADGLNVADLTFLASDGSVEYTHEGFQITMPVFYTWTDCQTTAKSGSSNFFNFENGRAYSISQIETLDPVTAALSYQAHTSPNVLSSSVSEDDYYSIMPYIYQHSLGSGSNLYGPASNASRMGGLGSPIASSAYGTPSVIMFVLDSSIEAENTLLEKVKSGTFTEADFDPAHFSTFDIGSRNATGELTAANYAPEAGTTTTPYDANPGTVILVMHMKPNYDTWAFSMDNVYKFGIMEMTNLTYTTSAHYASAKFNAMWQRTPHNGK